jgi:hypothetical protein
MNKNIVAKFIYDELFKRFRLYTNINTYFSFYVNIHHDDEHEQYYEICIYVILLSF